MKTEQIQSERTGLIIGQRIVEATFEDWISYLFNHPAPEYGDHWSFCGDTPEWDIPLQMSAEFIARTFEDPDRWTEKYSLGQIAAGLEFTWNPSFGNILSALSDERIPGAVRQRVIRSLLPLYDKCFKPLCQEGLSHLSECLENPLNGACYMLWDVCPLYGEPDEKDMQERDNECLLVMEQTLQIDHDACRESALHGLGHWALSYPSQVRSIVDQEIKSSSKRFRPELLKYAEQAKTGNVQ